MFGSSRLVWTTPRERINRRRGRWIFWYVIVNDENSGTSNVSCTMDLCVFEFLLCGETSQWWIFTSGGQIWFASMMIRRYKVYKLMKIWEIKSPGILLSLPGMIIIIHVTNLTKLHSLKILMRNLNHSRMNEPDGCGWFEIATASLVLWNAWKRYFPNGRNKI